MPLLGAGYEGGKLFRSRNQLQEGLLLLRELVPRRVFVVVLAGPGVLGFDFGPDRSREGVIEKWR